MKVDDLDGFQLDHWVALAEQQLGGQWYQEGSGVWVRKGDHTIFRPSQVWECAGPLIHQHRMYVQGAGTQWLAHVESGPVARGSTLLLAVCRAIVLAKFGHEVPDQVA